MELQAFETYLKEALNASSLKPSPLLDFFWEGMNYSLFGGGKRFRPQLCVLTAQALKQKPEKVYPLASAIEMIHTYSLIHDDLPCLDNDDLRRGRPTHHRAFGEDMALLSGDALLTLAFFILAKEYAAHPKLSEVIQEVSKAAGVQGMVGGQVLDMKWNPTSKDKDLLKQIHDLKTGALISVAVRMSAVVCAADESQCKSLAAYGDLLGLAFQVSDDIQDAEEGETNKNFVSLLGLEKTKAYLKELSEAAIQCLSRFDQSADPLRQLVHFNQHRI